MTLRLYDSATRSTREFVPITPGQVGVYLCGATVQAPPHVGHIRSGLNFDVLRRWLTATGHHVTLVRNVTDIDDKILAKARAAGEPWWGLAATSERAFTAAYDVLGCLPPTVEPRATGHMTEMVELMERLLECGHAYAAGGDVYFAITTWERYGALSGQDPAHLLPAADPGADAAELKRDPRDFALWKAAKPGEPSWPSPWGRGRPGWHLECSAMAHRYLGAEFDIHGGGLDLVFPHHENEVAQSHAAGDPFARYWMHNAWVTTAGEKMSKSLGNSLLVSEVVRRVRPVVLRYYLASAHYRSMLEFSDEALTEAGAGYERLEGFLRRSGERLGAPAESPAGTGGLPAAFVAAMDDDLGVPQALAVVHDTVRVGNRLLAGSGPDGELETARAGVLSMLGVLGLDPTSPTWATAAPGEESLRTAVDALVALALLQRQAARERKDFGAADAVRDALGAAGVVVQDTPAGPRWSIG